MNENQLLLIDLSAIAHQIWHVSGNEPDPSFVSNQIVVKVRQLASEHPYAAICCDNGKSFRADIDASYKANRDTENRAPLRHQMDVACETLKKDGFPIWSVRGFEADDLVASAVAEALKIDGTTVLIGSNDKDLTQLIETRVTMKKLDGTRVDMAGVLAKFGVPPCQMGDFLALVGDKSDNIVGAKGIGAVHAAKLLTEFGSLSALYAAMEAGDVKPRGVTPAMRTNLMEFKDRWPVVAQLIALRSDVPIPFHEIAVERAAAPMPEADMEGFIEEDTPVGPNIISDGKPIPPNTPMVPVKTEYHRGVDRPEPEESKPDTGAAPGKPASPSAGELVPVSPLAPLAMVDFERELEPRNMNELVRLAQRIFDSRLFGAYGTPQAVMVVILSGRELGMGAIKSLKTHHIMDGRAVESADLIAGQVLSSNKAVYFRPLKRTDTEASFVTLRVGEGQEPFTLTYTIDEARKAWRKDQRAWDQSGWGRNVADMLVARCKSKLARLVYPDVVSGLYAPEEFE